jgi:hypothetical protein
MLYGELKKEVNVVIITEKRFNNFDMFPVKKQTFWSQKWLKLKILIKLNKF